MPTLKNAMNAGKHLVNDHRGEQLILDIQWTVPYQQFDGELMHRDVQGTQTYRQHILGFYETFMVVQAYAAEHNFPDLWQVVEQQP